jgi:HlyD family secretion protein
MEATFTVDAYPTEKFKGTVRQIRNAPQTVQNVVTYDAVIDVDNTALKLKPGMTSNVTFIYAEKDDALKVPNAALRFKPTPEMLGQKTDPKTEQASATPRTRGPKKDVTPDRRTVWVLRGSEPDAKPVAVPIKIGVSDGSVSEVVEGDLKAGDPVITDTFTAGDKAPARPPSFRGF